MTPTAMIDAFAGLDVLVVGEAMLDRYVSGHVDRVCREAPVPVVALDDARDVPGGAANAAAAVAGLGARVALVSAVGNDADGLTTIECLQDAGVATEAVFRVPARTTMVKQRVSANGQLMLRLDTGSEHDLDEIHERRLIDALTAAWRGADAVIVSDYGYGICTPGLIAAIAALQARTPRILVGDAKDLTRWARVGLTAAKPNYGEALQLARLASETGTLPRVEQVVAARDTLRAATGATILTVTLDTAGAVVFEDGVEPYRTFTRPSANANATGAGDTFTATLALALAAGAHSAAAADLASLAATACVATPGTTTCTADMLRAQLAGEARMHSLSEVASEVGRWRASGRRIVFTNGCFDILHHGHISYLNRAKAMGDVLVVGLNSDASVRALKGPTRPINEEEDRAALLAALSCVDRVVLFDDPTPSRLIEAIRPDLFVKGGDYTIATLPEAPLVQSLGGEVKLLPFLDDRSTTGIIERIRASYAALDAVG